MSDLKSERGISRNFYFYDLAIMYKDQSGNYQRVQDGSNKFYDAFSRIRDTIENTNSNSPAQKSLILNVGNGETIHALPEPVVLGQPISFRLVLDRTEGLPLIEQEGAFSSLHDHIENDFALAEITHCVIFPDTGIMGAEFNFSGARATSIKYYLPYVISDIDYVYCTVHLEKDVFDRLESGKPLSLFDLAIRNTPEVRTYLMNQTSFLKLPFTNISDVDIFEIVLKRKRGGKGFHMPLNFDEARDLISTCGDDVQRFKISQGAIHRDEIDLLRQRVVFRKSVIRQDDNTVDSQDAFRIIIDLYNNSVKGTLIR